MLNFQYFNHTRFIFGKGEEDNVGRYVKEYEATKVLVLRYGTGMDFENKLMERVFKSLKDEGVEYIDFTGIQPNPLIEKALEAVELIKKEGVDFLLPVGGGSVIDTAKFASVQANYDGDAWDDLYIAKKPIPKTLIPVGAISTIAASGSENSPDSVIAKGALKRTLSNDKLRPVFAIMDPELSYTLPARLTAAGAADMISHACERYFSPGEENLFTDELNEAAIRTVIRYAPIALREPENYNARAHLLWAGLLAHNGLFEVGRGCIDGAVHMIESEIAGMYHSIHGMGCGCVTQAWAKYIWKRNIPKFVAYFTKVWGIDYDPFHPEEVIKAGIERMTQWYASIGVPTNLAELGVKIEDVPTLISTTRKCPNGYTGNMSALSEEDLLHIYRIGLGLEESECS